MFNPWTLYKLQYDGESDAIFCWVKTYCCCRHFICGEVTSDGDLVDELCARRGRIDWKTGTRYQSRQCISFRVNSNKSLKSHHWSCLAGDLPPSHYGCSRCPQLHGANGVTPVLASGLPAWAINHCLVPTVCIWALRIIQMKSQVGKHSLYADKFARLFYLLIQVIQAANYGRWCPLCQWWLRADLKSTIGGD